MEDIKKRSRNEREESGNKKMKRGEKRPATATDCKKLEGILEQLHNFLVNANRAAEAHTRLEPFASGKISLDLVHRIPIS